jgi:DNA-directed RNA polymerase alpha subunit
LEQSVEEDEDSVCSICSVKFEIAVKNVDQDCLMVTSHDIRSVRAKSEHQRAVVPVEYELLLFGKEQTKPIPIVKLGKNQELRLECIAKKGIGQYHAKWSPVCVCSLRYEPIIRLNQNRDIQLNELQKKKIIGSCPKNVFDLEDINKTLMTVKEKDCIYCFECLKKTEEFGVEDYIKIEEGDFIFEVETNGSLRPDEIGNSLNI